MIIKTIGNFVRYSSRNSVINNFIFIKTKYLSKNKIVTKSNRLSIDAIKAIKHHYDNHHVRYLNYRLKETEVGTYISASSLSHLIDGWGYLSNAVNAYLNGNVGVAIHLAYYSELRAVMSFLAIEGMGIFDSRHLSLLKNNSFKLLKNKKINQELGTHRLTWHALEKWCKIKLSFDLLKIFKVKGFNFEELTQNYHPAATTFRSSNIIKDWLIRWALDVKKYRNDREFRNFVSYRPQSISNFDFKIGIKDTIDELYKIFNVLGPLGKDPFNLLDQYLLKDLFITLHSILSTSLPYTINTVGTLAEDSFNKLGSKMDEPFRRILSNGRNIADDHLIFSEANRSEFAPLPMIARASLLLRIATGSFSLLLKDAGIKKEDLNFIWQNYGFNNGFWEVPYAIDEFYKLWVEVEQTYTEINNQIISVNDNPFSVKTSIDEDTNLLSQFNRAVLWGI